MTPGCIVELLDHLPLFTGAGLRAGSRWTVDAIYPDRGVANIASNNGAIVACSVPMSRLREVVVQIVTDEDF